MEGLSDDWLAEDYLAFENCEARAGKVREGYWSPFSMLAWIVSRDERFVAATQLYEIERYANRGGPHTSTAWIVLSNVADARFGRAFSDAVEDLREALEAGHIDGGTAIERATNSLILVPRHLWREWQRSFEHWGLVLIPGHYDFKWPSEAVRAAFPPDASPAKGAQFLEQQVSAHMTRIGDGTLRTWFLERVKGFEGKRPPRWQECLDAAKAAFPKNRVTKDHLLEIRKEVAPNWRPGRR